MQQPDGGGESGYTLVGLMVAVAVINVSLAVAVTSTRTLGRRAREAELIWRGEQIARAVGCYEQASTGQPLTRFEQLVETNCLRRLYRDPMASDGQWRVLRQQDVADGTIAALLGAGVDDNDAAAGLASNAGPVDQGSADDRGGLATGVASSATTIGRSTLRVASAGAGGENAIVGVVSHSAETSLRVYGDRTKYSQWVFVGGQAVAAGAARPLDGGTRAPSGQGLIPRR